MSDQKIVILRDGFWHSLITDTYSFAGFIAILLINKYLLHGGWLFSGVMAMLLALMCITRASGLSKRFNSKEEAIKHIEQLE